MNQVQYIEIYDVKDNTLIDLSVLLKVLKPCADTYYWAITHIVSVRKIDMAPQLEWFDEKVENETLGIHYSYTELVWVADQIIQVIDCQILASSSKDSLKKYSNLNESFQNCELVVCGFDTSYWGVFSKNFDIIQMLCNTFDDIKVYESVPVEFKDFLW